MALIVPMVRDRRQKPHACEMCGKHLERHQHGGATAKYCKSCAKIIRQAEWRWQNECRKFDNLSEEMCKLKAIEGTLKKACAHLKDMTDKLIDPKTEDDELVIQQIQKYSKLLLEVTDQLVEEAKCK